MATMDDLIKEILAEYEPRPILDEPIPEAEERLQPRWPFTDLDDHVPHPERLPAYYSAFFVRATDVSATIFGGTHTPLFPVETDGDIEMPRKRKISARLGYMQQRGEQGTPYSARLGDCHFWGRPNFQLDRQ